MAINQQDKQKGQAKINEIVSVQDIEKGAQKSEKKVHKIHEQETKKECGIKFTSITKTKPRMM